MKNVIDTEVFKGSWGQREVCACDEKFAFGKIDPTLLWEGEQKPCFNTCQCIADLYLSIHCALCSKWQCLALGPLLKAAVPHACHHIYSALSFRSCQFIALWGAHLMTGEKAQPFPGPGFCHVSTTCQGHVKLNLHYLWAATETPLLIISQKNFHKKPPRPRLAAKAYFQVLSEVDVITKTTVRVCCGFLYAIDWCC